MIKYEYHGEKEEGQLDDIIVLVRDTHWKMAWMDSELPHIERHSPDGFQWGYNGSGPADLALSILTHFCEKRDLIQEVAEIYYQDFKREFIVTAGDEFKIKCKDIARWLADKDPQLEEELFEKGSIEDEE